MSKLCISKHLQKYLSYIYAIEFNFVFFLPEINLLYFLAKMLIYKETLFVEMLFRNEMLPPDRFVQSFNTFVFLNFVDLYYSDENVCVF